VHRCATGQASKELCEAGGGRKRRCDGLMQAKGHRFIAWGRTRLPEAEKERLAAEAAQAPKRPGWRGLLDRWRVTTTVSGSIAEERCEAGGTLPRRAEP
jgi:hypothetical protein